MTEQSHSHSQHMVPAVKETRQNRPVPANGVDERLRVVMVHANKPGE